MFKDLNLSSVYFSREKDIARDFYNPVLMEAETFDRVSAYFSSKALSYCAEGLEHFESNQKTCRIIVSKDISEEDYNSIVKGYKLKESIIKELLDNISAPKSYKEEQNLSNLAYLIAKGVVEIKIAFVKAGCFHYKFGIYTDKNGDTIVSNGSDNFTENAIIENAESVTLTCSWQCSAFDYKKIPEYKAKFDELWNNRSKEAYVIVPENEVMRKILSYNRGEIVVDKLFLQKNLFILDYDDGGLIGYNYLSDDNTDIKKLMRVYLDDYIYKENGKQVVFNPNYGYLTFKEIIKLFEVHSPSINLQLTDRLKRYIDKKELYIRERAKLGEFIKNKHPDLNTKVEAFDKSVRQSMSRILRPQQVWDAYYMYAMRKSSNFSVPGSGKTTSALAVFSYLQSLGIVDRILVISPINAFQSWIDEFNSCFSGKQDLHSFNVQQGNLSTQEKKYEIYYNKSMYNLMLFNYESLEPYINELSKLVSNKTLLIFDEVHKVKGINGIRAQSALKVAKNADYVITMTGTPIPNSYLDIYNNLHILYPDEYNDYFNFSPTLLKNAKGRDIDLINEAIYPFFCRTSKDALGVPPANADILIKKDVDDNENKIFHILKSKYQHNKLGLIIRLLQLESDPSMLLEKLNINDFKDMFDIDSNAEDLDYVDMSDDLLQAIKNSSGDSTKIKTCVELVKTLHLQKKPVIIWTIFIRSMEKLYAKLTELGIKVKTISGETSFDNRVDILNAFKSGEIEVLITNPHTLAESVSLHSVCHDAIYYEYSYNLVHLLQSKDRIHRLGLPEHQYTQYYYIMDNFQNGTRTCSIDEEIYERLRLKEQIMLKAVDDKKLEAFALDNPEEDLDIIFDKLKI